MPAPAYFDETQNTWVLSRYRDVMAALRDPQLWPVAAAGEDQAVTRDEVGRLRLRGASKDALSAARVAQWEEFARSEAERTLDALPADRAVDLLAEYALPWCGELSFLVLNVPTVQRAHLSTLGNQVFAATGAPDDSPLRAGASAATAELERLLAGAPLPMGEPTFVATSQTTPRLLASIWVALFSQPEQARLLRANPALWHTAVDELLRFGGIVRRIWRQAREATEIGEAPIARGQRVMLMLAEANRDPEQFPDPDRLDVTRAVPAQFALGAGRNSCAGDALVRMAVFTGTRALLERFPDLRLCGDLTWRTGSGYRFPERVTVALSQKFYKL